MATGFKEIQFAVQERIAHIMLSRPPMNLLTMPMMREITLAINQVGSMNEVCAIAFSAVKGSQAFSAGMAIDEYRPQKAYQMLEALHGIFQALNISSKPVIALVTGAALGGACEIAAFADLVIATPAARFGQPEIKLGVFPPTACVILPRVIGEKKARELVYTGEIINAETARYLGLVNRLVPEEELETRAEEVFQIFRQSSVPSLEATRRAFQETQGVPFDEALKRAADIYLNDLMSHSDPVEGIEAYLAKRPPRWRHK